MEFKPVKRCFSSPDSPFVMVPTDLGWEPFVFFDAILEAMPRYANTKVWKEQMAEFKRDFAQFVRENDL